MERRVEQGLTRQGFQHYAPRYLPARYKQPRLVFPGYVLVKVEGLWRSIMGTTGVSRLIMSGEQPSLLPQSEVDALQARTCEDGYMRLPAQTFRAGQEVRVEEGPFEGFAGLYEGQAPLERCVVLLSVMGRLVRTHVEEASLAAA